MHYITLLFSSLPIGAFRWPITSMLLTYLLIATLCNLLSIDYLSLRQFRYYFPNCVHPNPGGNRGAPGENPRLSAERRQIPFTWVRSENRRWKALALTIAPPKPRIWYWYSQTWCKKAAAWKTTAWKIQAELPRFERKPFFWRLAAKTKVGVTRATKLLQLATKSNSYAC
jgi:hypothetical protein